MDLPPEILIPDAAPGAVIEFEFRAELETITVVAQDPEEQPLAFVWQIPSGISAPPNTVEAPSGGITTSYITLPADADLDDTILAVAIFDPSGNDVNLAWHLVVP